MPDATAITVRRFSPGRCPTPNEHRAKRDRVRPGQACRGIALTAFSQLGSCGLFSAGAQGWQGWSRRRRRGRWHRRKEAYFSLVDIIAGGGSWQALLATVRDELLVPVLEMNEYRSGNEAVYYRDSDRDAAIHLETFEIGRTGTQDWTNTINGLAIGDRS